MRNRDSSGIPISIASGALKSQPGGDARASTPAPGSEFVPHKSKYVHDVPRWRRFIPLIKLPHRSPAGKVDPKNSAATECHQRPIHRRDPYQKPQPPQVIAFTNKQSCPKPLLAKKFALQLIARQRINYAKPGSIITPGSRITVLRPSLRPAATSPPTAGWITPAISAGSPTVCSGAQPRARIRSASQPSIFGAGQCSVRSEG